MANDIDPAMANIAALLDGAAEKKNSKGKHDMHPKLWIVISAVVVAFIVGGGVAIGGQSVLDLRQPVIVETVAFQELTREIALQSGISPLELRSQILNSLSE